MRKSSTKYAKAVTTRKFLPLEGKGSGLQYFSLWQEQKKLIEPADEAVKTLIVWGWSIQQSSNTGGKSPTLSKPNMGSLGVSAGSYSPAPIDLKNVSLSRDMIVSIDQLRCLWLKLWCSIGEREF